MSDTPEMKDVLAAVEGVNKAFVEAQTKNDERLKEIEAKGSADVLTTDAVEKLREEVKSQQAIIDKHILEQKRANRIVTDETGAVVDFDMKADQWAHRVSKANGTRIDGFDAAAADAYKSAHLKAMLKGTEFLSPDEHKALSVGVDPSGGYFVSPDMSGRMVAKVYETSPMRAYASVQVTSRDSLSGKYDNDEVTTFWEGETETPQEGATPDVAQWEIRIFEQRTILKATQQLLEDADFNVEAWLIDKGGDKKSRSENAAFVNGTGVGRPRGFLTYPGGSDLTNSIARFKTGVNGDFAAAPDGTDKIRTMMADLKAEYRGEANFFMNRTTEGEVMLLKDSDGRPLWQPSVQAGTPAALMGRPIAIFEDMPDTATGALSIAYGNMRRAYQIADRLGTSTLRDPYSYKPFVGFYMRARVGGDMINGEALKLLEFSA